MKKTIAFVSIIFLLQTLLLPTLIPTAQASSGSGTFTQNDWSGGAGQNNFGDANKFKESGGDGVYATQNLRMKINADTVVGQENFGSNAINGGVLNGAVLNGPYNTFSDGTHLFVADTGNNRVLIYNSIPTTSGATADVVVGQANFTSVSFSAGATQMSSPSAVYSDGTRLFVADSGNNRILIYSSIPTANGAAADVVVGQSDFLTKSSGTSATKMYSPSAVYSDGTRLFVPDYYNNRVLIYNSIPTANGVAADVVIGQTDFVTSAAGISATKLNRPQSAEVYNGKLFIVDATNNRVLIYNTIPTSNGVAADVAIGQTDLVSNSSGTSAAKLNGPRGVDVYNGKILIADQNNNRVLIYNSIPMTNGAAANNVIGQTDLVTGTAGLSSTKFNNAYKVNVFKGKLFVTDINNNRILIYNSIPTTDGAAADTVVGQSDFTLGAANQGIGAQASEEGLRHPVNSIIVNNKLIVVDYSNSRVLIYNSIPMTNGVAADVVVGQSDFTTGSSGTTATKMNYPIGVYSDGTKLFVADTSNRRVLIYNSIPTTNGVAADFVIGQTDFTSNSSGTSDTKMSYPDGIYSDGTKLFVVDGWSHRILIYNSIPATNGAAADVVIGQPDFTSNSSGISSTKMYYPSAVYSDGTRLFVTDNNNRVLIYNSIPTTNGASADVVVGQPDFATSSVGTSATKMNYPSGAYSDGTRLFVADNTGQRVLIYNSIPTTNGVAADEVVGQADFTSSLAGVDATKLGYPVGVFSTSQYMLAADYPGNRVLLYLKAAASSTLTSSAYRTSQEKDWGPITWDAMNTEYSGVKVEIKTDQSEDWSTVTNGQDFIGRGKSIQYRVTLMNVDGLSSPTFNSISIGYQEATSRNLADIQLSFASANSKQDLNDDSKTYTQNKQNTFRGQDSRLTNGQVKIYKNGRKIKTIEADSEGKWRGRVTINNQGIYNLEFKFYDQYASQIYSKEYDLKIDTEKPTFKTPFPDKLTQNKNQPITFTATDNNEVSYYKIKLLDKTGHTLRSWKKQKSDTYLIPEVVDDQVQTILVRAYDKAGNYQEERMAI